ncbi:MAG: HAMP domain-containing protein, partial [Bdellovibrionales bacterium]|nr:HAMP domain-containing protein [Bdellovibrionales bacterium]
MGLKTDEAIKAAVTESLKREVSVVAFRLSSAKSGQLTKRSKAFLDDNFAGSEIHLSVISPDDKFLYDSRDLIDISNLNTRPEIVDARGQGLGIASRESAALRSRMLYVAKPVSGDGPPLIVRAGLAIDRLPSGNFLLAGSLLWIAIPLLALVCAIAYFVAARLTKPIGDLQRAASAYAQGDFEYPLPSPDPLELRLFVHALKKMRAGILQHLRTVDNHKKELESILVSMREGIIAVDTEERILRINEVTVHHFGCA